MELFQSWHWQVILLFCFFRLLLMSAGFPALLLILAAGAGVCYNSLFYQNGNNVKTRAAFLATLFCNADSVYSDFCYLRGEQEVMA